ncbi:MAG: hypothetical protein HY951_05970 [Bacteroidia bacterium]|nr:hypothetical protein [Bacteroidia bacterium]
MNRLFLILFQLIAINFIVTSQNQIASTLSFSEYFEQKAKGNLVILDIYSKPYKIIKIADSSTVKGQLYLDSVIYTVDTTIFVGFELDKNDKNINGELLIKYFHENIKSPKFQSENETSVFSFLIDENAKFYRLKF